MMLTGFVRAHRVQRSGVVSASLLADSLASVLDSASGGGDDAPFGGDRSGGVAGMARTARIHASASRDSVARSAKICTGSPTSVRCSSAIATRCESSFSSRQRDPTV